MNYTGARPKIQRTPNLINNNNKAVEKVCPFCSKNHLPINCLEFKNHTERWNRATTLNLCFNCLRNNHKVMECYNRNRCSNCRAQHHLSLCNHTIQNPTTTAQINKGKEIEEKKLDTNINMHVNNGFSPKLRASAIPTALLLFTNDRNNLKARAFFDTGSQRSYISKNLVERLGFETNR